MLPVLQLPFCLARPCGFGKAYYEELRLIQNNEQSLWLHRRRWLQSWGWEHGIPLLFYAAWSAILSWPLLRYFTTHLVSDGGDARHNLWVLWHVKEALSGRQPFWDLPELYYPLGASLLTHGVGPATGFLALPFWPLGPEAAHNGAVLLSLILTGYAMYLLARGLHLERSVALFTGLFLLATPMHLAGLLGHMSKVFMAGPPLALLGLVQAMRLNRSYGWAGFTGAALLLTLAHNGYQFVFTCLLMPFVALLIFWQHERPAWRPLTGRLLLVGLACAAITGPLVLAIKDASRNSGVQVDKNIESLDYQPDAVEFLLPDTVTSRFLGPTVHSFLARRQIEPTIETTVYLSWTGLVLGGVVLLKGNRWSRGWFLLSAGLMVLGLGPVLQIMGARFFTEYHLSLPLPYAFMTALPGVEFMRVPGRSMMVGYTVWGLTVGMGLAWLVNRWPRRGRPILLTTTALMLIEFWPISWPVEALQPIPAFYRELAADEDMYGVLDLPIKPTPETWHTGYSSYYQVYQMTHRKGLATGYVSRTYDAHPLFPCIIPEMRVFEPDVFIDGGRVDCRQNLLFDLAAANYRYVTWHRPQPDNPLYESDSWGERQAAALIEALFADQPPLVADELARVYRVPSLTEASKTLTTTMVHGEGWDVWEDGFRWATSPATLFITIPWPQQAILELVPDAVYPPDLGGVLYVSLNDGPESAVTIWPGEVAEVPLTLPAGVQRVQLRLGAGNFRPYYHDGGRDRRWLSFAVRSLNLRLLEGTGAGAAGADSGAGTADREGHNGR